VREHGRYSAPVPDVVIYADTFRSPELRHEVPLGVADPFLYVEKDGARHVVVSAFEIPLLERVGDYELHPFEEYGIDELRRSGLGSHEMFDELVLRAVRALGVERAVVPGTFPILVADRLRDAGVELEPDRGLFDDRRRVKTAAELAGIRRAQAAAEAGMAAACALLAEAGRDGDGGLVADGEPLTSERVKAAISQAFLERGASADVFIVSHGPQAAIGHHVGEGQFRAGETIVIDLFPRDNESSCSADMTRTFVVGEVDDEVAEWHRLCREALERAIDDILPGVRGREVFDRTCELFEAAGYPTQRTKAPGEVLSSGFHHSLGHGVGLEVHEQPLLGFVGHEPLVAGDVLAVEPGLYRAGYGGLRLEDLVLVGEDGAERLTSFPYDLTP
jgi:Xaa-Pro aminopeptidase